MFFPMHCKDLLQGGIVVVVVVEMFMNGLPLEANNVCVKECPCWRFVWPWIPSHTHCTLKYSSLNKKLQTKKHLVAPSYMAGDLREMSTSSSESQPCHVHVHTFLRTFPRVNSASTRAPTASVAGASLGLMLMRQRLRPVARSFRLRLCCPGNLPIA